MHLACRVEWEFGQVCGLFQFVRHVRLHSKRYLCIFGESSVLLLGHQGALRLAADLDLCNPAVAFRVLVQVAGLLLQRAVDLGDGTSDRAENVRRRLDRFDSADGITSAYLEVNLGQFDVDDVAQSLRGVLGDSKGDWTGCQRTMAWRGSTMGCGDIQVLPSAEASIHSWSSVYFFSRTAHPSALASHVSGAD